MLKKVLVLSVALGMGTLAVPAISQAAIDTKQPVLQAPAVLIDDTSNDSANSNGYDNSIPSDSDDTATSNDDNNGDDGLSSDATE